MKPRAILFDFGGTLADVFPSHEWLFIRACQEFEVEVDAALVRAAQDEGWEAHQTPEGPAHPQRSVNQAAFARFKTGLLAERLQRMGVDGPVEAIAARVLELDTQPEMYRVFEDVVPTLAALRERGYAMAIVSNHEWALPDLVAGLGLAHYFVAVITSARAGYRKPHPRIFQQALGVLDAQPQEVLMVGDSLATDIQGAVRLGMQAVLLDRRGDRGQPLGVPVLRELTSLVDFAVE